MAVGWGVIGACGIARRRTIPEMVQYSKKAELVAVMDIMAEPLEEVKQQFGAKKSYATDDELLADPDITCVYIATPAVNHAEQIIKAAQAGKHVLCEKPLGMNAAECEKAVNACKDAGVKLGTAYMMRFHACHQAAKKIVADGQIGKPVLGRAQLSCWYPKMEGAWRQDPKTGGGGSLIDMGCHCVDLLEHIMGTRVTEVSCFADTQVQDYRVEDSATVICRFDNGAHGIVDNFWCVPDAASKNRLEVYGSAGSLFSDYTIGQESTGQLEVRTSPQGAYDAQQARVEEKTEILETGRYGETAYGKSLYTVHIYAAEIDAFTESVENDVEPPIPGEDGWWNQKIMDACYESARTGRTVKISW